MNKLPMDSDVEISGSLYIEPVSVSLKNATFFSNLCSAGTYVFNSAWLQKHLALSSHTACTYEIFVRAFERRMNDKTVNKCSLTKNL